MAIQRVTKSVKAMQRYFGDRSTAVSVVDLVEHFRGEMNKVTVYRILSRMEAEGIIHSFSGSDGLKWYAACKQCTNHSHYDHHPHFQCKVCGMIECLEISLPIPKLKNRKVDTEIILLIGECETCAS
ncbi:MAG: transcriptional repressor [Bacteroidota bacterium]